VAAAASHCRWLGRVLINHDGGSDVNFRFSPLCGLQVGHHPRSKKCHFRTHASQQDERSCTAIRSPRRRGQKRRRHVEAERLRHDQVNEEVELGRLLDRKIGGLRPPQNLVDQVAGAALKSMKATVPTRVENSYCS
jgi:hypothetical protein